MPEDVAWPRTEDGAPLQFVAQVCCADLPKEMWGGIGPREGWLLLFVDCYSMEDMEIDGSIVQVRHIPRLGPDREPPEDMGTYRNAMVDYIDYHTPTIRPGIPKMWRRWPVDLVVQEVPKPKEWEGEMVWAPNPVDASALYGAPVADGKGSLRLTVTEDTRPLTWRGVLYLLDEIEHGLKSRASSQASNVKRIESGNKGRRDRFPPGWVAKALEKAEVNMASLAKPLGEWERRAEQLRSNGESAQKALKGLEDTIRTRKRDVQGHAHSIALLKAYASDEAEAQFSRDVVRSEYDHLAWIGRMQQLVAEMRGEVLGHDQNRFLTDAGWLPIRERLTSSTSITWYIRDEQTHALRILHRLLSEAASPMVMALREDVLDLYTRDAATRAAIPQTILDELEPQARVIAYPTAPHRMGGPHDVVQEPDEQNDSMLLFQIFSDYPMGWMWADVGALYVSVEKSDLAAGRFDRIEARLEGG
jgi:uncharacterized protein YwqG